MAKTKKTVDATPLKSAPSRSIKQPTPVKTEKPHVNVKVDMKSESKPENKMNNKVDTKAESKTKTEPKINAESKTLVENKEPKSRVVRKGVTVDSVNSKLDIAIAALDKEIELRQKDRTKGSKSLRSIRKILTSVQTDTKKLSSTKRSRASGANVNANKVSGFVLDCVISPELRDFLQLKEGERPTRTDITNALCTYVHIKDGESREQMLKWKMLNPKNRDLQDPTDKMVIIPDDKLKKLLKYDNYVSDVAKGLITKKVKGADGKYENQVVKTPQLKYWVLQKLVQPHVLETIKKPVAPLVDTA